MSFANDGPNTDLGMTQKACRPDPEELLQQERQRIEDLDRCEAAMKVLHEAPLHFPHGDVLASLLGNIQLERWRTTVRIVRLLKEIDNGK